MNAFENEKLILESDNKQIRLTSHRLRYHQTPRKNSDFTSIMLDKVSSIELTYYKHSIWLLVIGILTLPAIIGFVILLIYFSSKRHVISVTPDGGKPIIFNTKGIKREFLSFSSG